MPETHKCTSRIRNPLHSSVSHIMETPPPNKPDAEGEDKGKVEAKTEAEDEDEVEAIDSSGLRPKKSTQDCWLSVCVLEVEEPS